jgi:octaprenyl-diphosphate synthase
MTAPKLPLERIYAPVQAELTMVEREIRAVASVDFPRTEELLRYTLSGGKGIRPALTLLAGIFHNYDLNLLIPMATAIELMHTATLVHDDAIDKSDVRRGRATVNKLWGEDRAVLLGDYLFAKSGELCTTTGNVRVIMLFIHTLRIISSGELIQSFDAFKLEQTMEHYLERIARKTAALFATATETGAVLSQAPETSVQALRDYGYNLGIAFQIIDDILDFAGTEEEMGKPIGSDLAQGTLTLPAMLILERYPQDNPIRELFTRRDMPVPEKQARIKQAIDMVHGSSEEKECFVLAADYCAKACAGLDQLADIPARRSLRELAEIVLSRHR